LIFLPVQGAVQPLQVTEMHVIGT